MYQYTRAQYMAGECSHYIFFSQFVTPGIKNWVLAYIAPIDVLREKYQADPRFNNIPLAKWDRVGRASDIFSLPAEYEYSNPAPQYMGKKYYSLGSAVCILKAAARMLAEGE